MLRGNYGEMGVELVAIAIAYASQVLVLGSFSKLSMLQSVCVSKKKLNCKVWISTNTGKKVTTPSLAIVPLS